MGVRSSPGPDYIKKTDLTAAQLSAGHLIELQTNNAATPAPGVPIATSIIMTPSDVRVGFAFGTIAIAGTPYASCKGAELGRLVARVPGLAGQGSGSPTTVTHLWLIAAEAASVDVSLNEVA